MKHRRSILKGRRPKPVAIVAVMVSVALSLSGVFAFQAYAGSERKSNGQERSSETQAKRHHQDWRDRQSPKPTKTSRSPRPSATASTTPAKPSASATSKPTTTKPAPASTTTAPATAAPTVVPPVTGGGGGDCALPAYPTAACTGVPAGWTPKTTQNGDLTVTKAGSVIENYLVTGSIYVKAAGVTIKNTRVYGTIDNFLGDNIYGHLLIQDTEVVNPPGQEFSTNDHYAFGVANYTCVRCKVVNRMEGWRVGADSYAGTGPVVIQDSFAQLAVPPGMCKTDDPHGDGIQGYGGPMVTIKHNTIDQRGDDCPTAPIFIPNQGNAGATVQDNVLAGGGYALRLTGGDFPAVTGNKIVQGSFGYGPVELSCSLIGQFSGNATVNFDFGSGKVTSQVKALSDC